jgi:hypothetical protein
MRSSRKCKREGRAVTVVVELSRNEATSKTCKDDERGNEQPVLPVNPLPVAPITSMSVLPDIGRMLYYCKALFQINSVFHSAVTARVCWAPVFIY